MIAPKFIVIAGATASGKSEVARQLHSFIPIEIISADSMQVYRGMSILTQGTPTKTPRTHLVSFLSPSKEYNASQFRNDALALIMKINERKKMPVLVGGTGLYLRALLDGLFESDKKGPDRDESLRKKLIEAAQKHGNDYLHRRLQEVDAVSAAKIHPNDTRRLVRAIEIFELTGKPFSAQKSNRKGIRDEWPHRFFFLDRDREDLYDRINRRVDQMMRQGLLEEVKGLSKKKLSQTAQMALGIKEMKVYLEGHISMTEATELLKKNTRNYAKRQLSWFRNEKGVEVVPVNPNDSAKSTALKIAEKMK